MGGANAAIDTSASEFIKETNFIDTKVGEDRYAIQSERDGKDLNFTNSNITVKSNAGSYDDWSGGIRAGAGANLTVGTPASSVKVEAKGRYVSGLHARAGNLTINGKELQVIVDASGVDNAVAYGINVQGDPNDNGSSATLEIKAENTYIKATSPANGYAAGLSAMAKGILNIDGNLTVEADNVLVTRGQAHTTINKSGLNTIKLTGDINFDYDKKTSDSPVDAYVDVTLTGKDSFWTGNSYVSWGKNRPDDSYLAVSAAPVITLNNGAIWTPTQVEENNNQTAHRLDKLTLDNGVVNLNSDVDTGVKTLSGSGTFNVAVNSADHKTGKFEVGQGGDQVGKLEINLTGVDSDTVDVGEAKKIVGNTITGVDKTKLAINIAEGNYNDAISVSRDGKVTKTENKKMRDSVVMHRGSTGASIRMLGNDIRKRLGDLRYTDSQNGSWVRYDGGRMSASGISNKFNTLQLGYDTADLVDNVRLGAALSYTRSDAELRSGSADVDTYSMAMYGAWMADNGMFADVIARVATVKNETMLGTAKGDIDNMVYALSGEFGQRFDVAKNFFVEPQVELTYTYVDSDSMKMNNGAKYKYDSIDSLIGRAGVAVGLTCPNQKGQIYARASVVREFMGDTTVTGGGRSMKEDGQDTWAEIGLGAQYNINKNAYVWADVERTQGADINEDFRGTVGVRFNF